MKTKQTNKCKQNNAVRSARINAAVNLRKQDSICAIKLTAFVRFVLRQNWQLRKTRQHLCDKTDSWEKQGSICATNLTASDCWTLSTFSYGALYKILCEMNFSPYPTALFEELSERLHKCRQRAANRDTMYLYLQFRSIRYPTVIP